LFAAGEFPNINVFTMNVDGSDRRNISPNPGFDYDPVWSPDGQTIALVTAVRGQGPRVWLMNADGSGRRRVTTSVEAEERPAWSRDGRQLAFQSAKRGGGPHDAYIHVVDIGKGTDRRLGTHDKPYLDETPSWFPDDRRLAFQSDRRGRMEIWVMNADGSGQRPLQRESGK
jgi:TolB protein